MSGTITPKAAESFIDKIAATTAAPQAAGVLGRWNDILAGDLGRGFLDSNSPRGVAWKPIKPRPPGHNQGTRPLIDFGDLMRSVVSDGKGHIEIVTEDATMFGTDIFYADYHQSGRKHIAARPFMGVPEKTLKKAAEMIGAHIIETIS